MTYPVLVVSISTFSVLVFTIVLGGSDVTDIAVDNTVVGNDEETCVVVVIGNSVDAYERKKENVGIGYEP